MSKSARLGNAFINCPEGFSMQNRENRISLISEDCNCTINLNLIRSKGKKTVLHIAIVTPDLCISDEIGYSSKSRSIGDLYQFELEVSCRYLTFSMKDSVLHIDFAGVGVFTRELNKSV